MMGYDDTCNLKLDYAETYIVSKLFGVFYSVMIIQLSDVSSKAPTALAVT